VSLGRLLVNQEKIMTKIVSSVAVAAAMLGFGIPAAYAGPPAVARDSTAETGIAL